MITRGNRNFEHYFINGRYIKSSLLAKAIEEAYKSFLMQHQYPFTVLYFTFLGDTLDVNVHPTKMELRFGNNQEVYRELCEGLYGVLSQKEMIPEVPVTENKADKVLPEYKEPIPEPFEKRRLNDIRAAVAKDSPYEVKYPERRRPPQMALRETPSYQAEKKPAAACSIKQPSRTQKELQKEQELTLADIHPDFLTKEAKKHHRIIGQLFKTYWMVEFEEKLYIIDQHAAHEKVLFEQTMQRLRTKDFTSQMLSPPMVISLDAREIEMLEKYRTQIEQLGYVVEPFGGREYMISGIPDNLFHIDMKDLFIEMLENGDLGKA